MMSLRLALLLSVVALGVSRADGVNLVTNGSFETGSFSGWTVWGDTSECLFVGTAGDEGTNGYCTPPTEVGPHTGSFAAQLGNNDADAYLTQSISTTGTGTYEISFWLASQPSAPIVSDFFLKWGGRTIFQATNLPVFGYTFFDFTGLTAAGPTTNLTFGFRNDYSYLTLDDVSVVDPPGPVATPEPSDWAFFAAPVVMLLLRKSKSARKLALQA